MIKINDIKPILEIPDISIYLYYGLIICVFLCLIAILYIIYKFFQPKIQTNDMQYFKILQDLDFIDTKLTAYKISKYGRYLAKDDRQIRLIEELSNDLSIYKYKKDVSETFDLDIKTKFSVFMDSLDVK